MAVVYCKWLEHIVLSECECYQCGEQKECEDRYCIHVKETTEMTENEEMLDKTWRMIAELMEFRKKLRKRDKEE